MANSPDRVLILGTGLLGSSIGLALRAAGFAGTIVGWDKDAEQLRVALERGAIQSAASSAEDALQQAGSCQLIVLGGPVYAIIDWMERLAGVLQAHQLVTDVGSTKARITAAGERLFNQPGKQSGHAGFLPGHPMAGKEVSGAAEADAGLFRGAAWIFTPASVLTGQAAETAAAWREWVKRFGAEPLDLEAQRHDQLMAWTSHLPQFVATALAALLEDEVGDAPELNQIGGRALREMTRLGSSPYSMWRDVASTNAEAIAAALSALEQRLAHLRENLRTPELRDEFDRANHFRKP
uniref:Prephenate dehydrogenase n=1 Tax=mine drainage metagenome TaxID=410659 RepID=E6QKL0_9ZZZZ